MISVGPLALVMERLFAVLGIITFMTVASWIGRRHAKDQAVDHLWRSKHLVDRNQTSH